MKLAKKTNGRQVRPLFRNLFDDFWGTDQFFEGEWLPTPRFQTPAVNIKDNEKGFEIEVAAPGLNKDDFDVTIENGILCITSEKEERKEEKKDNYTREEFNYTSFSRSFSLPDYVDPDSIEAKYKEGVLRLTLKKLELVTPPTKKIQIK